MDKPTEFHVLESVCTQLDELDAEPRERVIRYVMNRYSIGANPVERQAGARQPGSVASSVTELNGIALLKGDGSLRVTVRDLKGATAKDAARRLIYAVVLSNEMLTGSREVSSRKTLVPILREYRLYDGNTRALIASDKGVIRNGDLLSLDAHARTEAEAFLRDMQDPSIVGSWRPGAMKRKRT